MSKMILLLIIISSIISYYWINNDIDNTSSYKYKLNRWNSM